MDMGSFCQAQGVTSEFKYEAKGGPTLKNNYDLIVEKVAGTKKIEAMTAHAWLRVGDKIVTGGGDTARHRILTSFADRSDAAP